MTDGGAGEPRIDAEPSHTATGTGGSRPPSGIPIVGGAVAGLASCLAGVVASTVLAAVVIGADTRPFAMGY